MTQPTTPPEGARDDLIARAPPFAIGSNVWPGLAKLNEECCEVGQVIGKLMATGGAAEHWDGSNLHVRLEEEIADVMAATNFVVERNGLSHSAIIARVQAKLALFDKWHCEASNE